MKKLIALLTALTLLVPALALAQDTPDTHSNDVVHPGFGKGSYTAEDQVRLEALVKAQHEHASSSTSGPGKLGAAIKDIASSTRAELKGVASSTREVIQKKLDAIHTLIEQHRGEMQKHADDAKEKAKEHFGERVEKLVDHVSTRLASSSAALSTIAGRINDRITTLEDQGHDMSASASLLATAQTDLSAANVKITAVNTALTSAMDAGTTTAKAQIPAVRTAVKAAEDALALVKDDLQKTIRSIKVEAAATTTVSQ